MLPKWSMTSSLFVSLCLPCYNDESVSNLYGHYIFLRSSERTLVLNKLSVDKEIEDSSAYDVISFSTSKWVDSVCESMIMVCGKCVSIESVERVCKLNIESIKLFNLNQDIIFINEESKKYRVVKTDIPIYLSAEVYKQECLEIRPIQD